MTSVKTDLRDIFSKNPEHVNQEYVLRAKVKNPPVYVNPTIENDEELRDSVENHLVTIITPSSIDMVRSTVIDDSIRILQSTYENGRVLESSDKITINGEDYVITAKGVGTTNYYRETQAINPFMWREGYTIDENEKKALKEFPFYQYAGLYDMEKALLELERSQILQKMGVDTEIVLGIYELDEVIGPDGEYVSIKQLEKKGIITRGQKPVILLRAHKSNIRILDIFMLDKYARKESIPNLVNHILQESKIHWGTSDINEYIQRLVKTTIQNRLELIGKFGTINGEKWQDIVRNISIFGEELDLGTMRPMQDDWYYRNPHYIINHYDDELDNIFIGINRMIETIEENTTYKVDHEKLANIIFETVLTWVKNHIDEFKKIYKKYKWSKWEKKFDRVLHWIFRSCLSYFRNYIHSEGFTMILQERLKELEA